MKIIGIKTDRSKKTNKPYTVITLAFPVESGKGIGYVTSSKFVRTTDDTLINRIKDAINLETDVAIYYDSFGNVSAMMEK